MADPIRRSRVRAVFFVLVAGALAGGTGLFTWQTLRSYEAELAEVKLSQDISVLAVAARDLAPGTVIGPQDVKLVEHVHPRDRDSVYNTLDGVVGQRVGDRILAGELVRRQRLVEGGAGLGVNELLDAGMRAVTIRTNRASGVGGLLQPGYFVDVIVTIRPDTRSLSANWVTETILQGTKVLAVGDAMLTTMDEREEDDERTMRRPPREVFVTLEVSPAEARELALASSRGEVHLSLRGVDDFDLIEAQGPLVTNALVGMPEEVAKATRRRLSIKRARATGDEPVMTTDVIRGVQITTEQYDAQGTRVDPSSTR